ncbi:zinc finger protein Gfi-1 [Platysternon megacephalum]|uniref:Zinc finger protein Gfi-1 n=1 Tax=Platysternon megacephalum TaxID=55544 RepID=A0A4D9EE30_9SAUR|nr:zinc finger protein Gfi-1 [Platysternon megacephalum]
MAAFYGHFDSRGPKSLLEEICTAPWKCTKFGARGSREAVTQIPYLDDTAGLSRRKSLLPGAAVLHLSSPARVSQQIQALSPLYDLAS